MNVMRDNAAGDPSGRRSVEEGMILVLDREEDEPFWNGLRDECRVLFAPSAGKGLNMLTERAGLVFLCLELPDADSMDILEMIKKEYPSTAVIVMTAGGSEEKCVQAFRRGARDYIRKPLHRDEVVRGIRTLLEVRDTSHVRLRVSLMPEGHKDDFPGVPTHLLTGVLKVRDYISQNHSESLTLEEACKMASMSKTYFCRFFKDVTGHSLNSFQHTVRIKRADELLRDKRLSIMDIALRLGYCDSNYFSTIYKKMTGIPPRQRQDWRSGCGNSMAQENERDPSCTPSPL